MANGNDLAVGGAFDNLPPVPLADPTLSSLTVPNQLDLTPTGVVRAPNALTPGMSLASVVGSGGVETLIDRIIKREGGSPKGVVNNPGNIKFVGTPGQTDSGVHATDGGTFASYETPEAGRQAISNLINRAASGYSKAYGNNPTVDSFMVTYGGGAPSGLVAGGGLAPRRPGPAVEATGLPPPPIAETTTEGPSTNWRDLARDLVRPSEWMAHNPMYALSILQGLLGKTHSFTPIDYDPWKYVPQQRSGYTSFVGSRPT